MKCASCQTQLPDEAAYCLTCGAPQKSLVVAPPRQVQPAAQRTKQHPPLEVEVVGERVSLAPNKGILVVYAPPSAREELLVITHDSSYTDIPGLHRIREYRPGGFSVFAAVILLPPTVYDVYLKGKPARRALVEVGDVTEIDLR